MEKYPENNRKLPEYNKAEYGEIFGEHETVIIPVDKIAVLPQVREKSNQKQAELVDSIKEVGTLINPIDIVLFNDRQLSEHLEFINSIWKTDVNIDNYQCSKNGIYPVLIAGHSRLRALKTIQELTNQSSSVVCKIHDVKSSAEFLNLQLAENIHSGINPERRAVAIVEMYLFGFDENADKSDKYHWSSHADFVRKNQGSVSEDILRDSLALVELSPQARDFVFSGKLYYSSGVELGRHTQTIKNYIKHRLGESVTNDEIEKNYNYELLIIIAGLIDSRLTSKGSSKRAIKQIQSKISYMKEIMTPPDSDLTQISMINAFLNAPEIQRQEYIKSLKKEYSDVISKLKRQPADTIIDYLKLDSELTGDDHSIDIDNINQIKQTALGINAVKKSVKI